VEPHLKMRAVRRILFMDDSAEPIRMLTWLLLNTLGITVFVFGLLLWGYSVTIQLTHPEWLADTLTHHVFAPLNWRVDDVGIIGFAIAPFGFFTWIITRSRLTGSQHEEPRPLPRNAPFHAVGATNPITSPETKASEEPMISKTRRRRRTNKRPPDRR
jgi:hypothetical protein